MFNPGVHPLQIWKLVIPAISLMLFVVACGGSEPPPPTLAPTPTPGVPTATSTPEPPPATPTPSASDYIKRGIEYYEQDKLEEAIAEYEKAIELEPNNPDAHRNLGSVYLNQDKWAEAAAAYEQAINLKSDFGEAYGDLVAAYVGLGKLPEAIDAGEKAIELAPDYAASYNNLGVAYSQQGRFDEAVTMLKQAMWLDPDYAMPHYNIGLVHHTQGQPDQALADWQEAARLDPNYPSTHKNLGILYFEFDRLAEAVAELKIYLQLAPDAPDRAVIENDIATLTAQIAASSEEAAGQTSQAGAEPSLMDININRAPGHSIGFESSLEPGGAHRFLFMASPDSTIGASVASASDMRITIQDTETGQVLDAAPSNDNSLFVTIPEYGRYQIVIEDAGGQGGDYVAAFESSAGASFALDPNYFIISRLPEGGSLSYTYSAPDGVTLRGNVIPHPDTPVDLVVKIRDPKSLAVLLEANQSGPGENEQFSFTIPAGSNDKLLPYYVVSVEDVAQNSGAYILYIAGDAPAAGAPATSPERVVQTIFDAAQSGNFALLQGLCDPQAENDNDTQTICNWATNETDRGEFINYFAAGRISGEATISPDGVSAEVPFLFGPNGNVEETMELINRDGQWYLFGF